MARTRRRARSSSPRRQFTAGLVTGLAAAALVYFHQSGFLDRMLGPRKPVETSPPAAAAEPSPPPKFDFYSMLPEKEVAAEGRGLEVAPPKKAPETATDSAAPASGTGWYILQAGAFREALAAERLRATLALVGVEARIQATQAGTEGGTWYRVTLGPFQSLTAAREARARVRDSSGLNPMLLRAGT